ncbi:MAG: 4'-phosphopantetheinyl transferase superfamily protein [Muribaculaceae bacterium]|nr:4'-phosphopantetheinyl transferase superfamily protein [Muribaculaceae bacterium]MDE6135270.1 4'-phosphopantetheinyl transferase superfamily protein [Muribaculaceae bacterium]
MRHDFADHSLSIFTGQVSDSAGLTRATRERSTVAALMKEAFGSEIEILHMPDGAPFADVQASISISHCLSMAALAVAPAHCRPGVDIETLRPQLQRVASRVFSTTELKHYGKDLRSLTEAWTLKEAAYKAAGIPGLDFRREIILPTDVSRIITARGLRLEIVATFAIGEAILSAVINTQH